MPQLLTVTLDQLRARTKGQILTALGNALTPLTKRQLILLILKVQEVYDTNNDESVRENRRSTYYPDGAQKSHLDVVRDVLGTKRSSRGIVFTYGAEGEKIVMIDYNAADTPVKRTTAQYPPGGGNPEVTVEV